MTCVLFLLQNGQQSSAPLLLFAVVWLPLSVGYWAMSRVLHSLNNHNTTSKYNMPATLKDSKLTSKTYARDLTISSGKGNKRANG